tara:strand:+ start:1283 stop:1492 length:210 start_codon:yes stop_codon:yes gene_type:complete
VHGQRGDKANFKSKLATVNIFTALSTDKDWSQIFAFDEFTNKKMLLKQMPNRPGNPIFIKLGIASLVSM